MKAKVKITDLRTSQEYLLLVTKLNLKGLLVQSAHTLNPGTPVRLNLQLEDDPNTIDLKGDIHKIAERPDGGKGMIVRFADMAPGVTEHLRRYLETAGMEDGESTLGRSSEAPSRDKTMMVDINTLSKLTLASPEKDKKAMPSTMDEEAVHAARPGLAGQTRIIREADLQIPAKRSSSTKSWMWIPVFLLLATGGFLFLLKGKIVRYLDRSFGQKPQPSVQVSPTVMPTTGLEKIEPPSTPEATVSVRQVAPVSTSEPKVSAPAPVAPSPRVEGEIARVSFEETDSFVKVTLQGQGDFSKSEVTRAMSPRRLIIDLPKIRSFKSEEVLSVSKNPLLQVKISKRSNGVRITLDLYPVDFPRYDLKSYSDSLDIFLRR